jgi:hypothetical protein
VKVQNNIRLAGNRGNLKSFWDFWKLLLGTDEQDFCAIGLGFGRQFQTCLFDLRL